MASPLIQAFEAGIAQLKRSLIVEGAALTDYTTEDHDRALGFRVLASAQFEDFVEARCSEVAISGAERFLRGQPTRVGRALLAWHRPGNKLAYAIPLKEAEFIPDSDRVDAALRAYLNAVKRTHGVSGDNLKSLLIPLGLPTVDIDDLWIDKVDQVARERGRAAHLRVKRAKSMVEPIKEWQDVQDILGGLAALDGALDRALNGF